MKLAVVIPNLNGADGLQKCLKSLVDQSIKASVIVVDNGSVDNSVQVAENFGQVQLVRHKKNYGFAGGVNAGIKEAISAGAVYVATFNNDAVASKNWLEALVIHLDNNPDVGIATSKILGRDGSFIDSTGEFYTSWGLSYPRGRREKDTNAYDHLTHVFAGSGGATIYRSSMLKSIGLFDNDFFAYYEDVDLSFRARLAGWDVSYVPSAVVYHKIGATSSGMSGFVTKQTIRNLPLIIIKDLPLGLWPTVIPRFALAYSGIFFSAITQGKILSALAGLLNFMALIPKKVIERQRINKLRVLSTSELSLLLVRDLPPDAHRLRKLRSIWWQILGRKISR